MKIQHKKHNLKKLITIVPIVLLSIVGILSVFKFPGGGQFMVVFLIISSVLLFAEMSKNTYTTAGVGSITMYISSSLVIFFIAFLWFKLLNLQGAPILGILGIPGLAVFFPAMSVYLYMNGPKAGNHSLVLFLEKNRERMSEAVLIIVGFSIFLSFQFLLFRHAQFTTVIFLVFSLTLTGLIAYAHTWLIYTRLDKTRGKLPLLLISSVALVLFVLPMLGRNSINQLYGNIMIYFAYTLYALIIMAHYVFFYGSKIRKGVVLATILTLVYSLFKLGLNLQWFHLPHSLSDNVGMNVLILIIFTGLLAYYQREQYFRWFMAMTIMSHLFPSRL